MLTAAMNAVRLGVTAAEAGRRYGVSSSTIRSKLSRERQSGAAEEDDPFRESMDGDDIRLDARRCKAARLLVEGRPQTEVCRAVKATWETVAAWRQDPVFCQVMGEMEMAARHDAEQRLKAGARSAVDAHQEALDWLRGLVRRARVAQETLDEREPDLRAEMRDAPKGSDERGVVEWELEDLRHTAKEALRAALSATKAMPSVAKLLFEGGGLGAAAQVPLGQAGVSEAERVRAWVAGTEASGWLKPRERPALRVEDDA